MGIPLDILNEISSTKTYIERTIEVIDEDFDIFSFLKEIENIVFSDSEISFELKLDLETVKSLLLQAETAEDTSKIAILIEYYFLQIVKILEKVFDFENMNREPKVKPKGTLLDNIRSYINGDMNIMDCKLPTVFLYYLIETRLGLESWITFPRTINGHTSLYTDLGLEITFTIGKSLNNMFSRRYMKFDFLGLNPNGFHKAVSSVASLPLINIKHFDIFSNNSEIRRSSIIMLNVSTVLQKIFYLVFLGEYEVAESLYIEDVPKIE